MNSWQVFDSDTMVNAMQNELNQQWFWYSVNGGAVQSIDQIGGLNITTDDGSTLIALYRNSTLEVQVTYTLAGDGINPEGPGSALLNEAVSVYNLSSDNFNINFYEYANFNLIQNYDNGVTIYGQPGSYGGAIQTTWVTAADANTLVEQYANYAETGSPTEVMGDITHGNVLSGTTSFGPGEGDASWGLEWTSTVAPFAGDSDNEWSLDQAQALSISPVPEPATFSLFALGGLAGASFARRPLLSI